MYKIIDSVDLKELEKFGFRKYETSNTYYRKIRRITDGFSSFFEKLEINGNDRIIRTVLYEDLSDQYWEGNIVRNSRILDLDNAGLIEGVYNES